MREQNDISIDKSCFLCYNEKKGRNTQALEKGTVEKMKIKKIASILLTAGMICSMAALTSFADNASSDEAYIDSLVDQMKITETVIEVPGITQTYTYLQIADSHSNLVDDDANQQRIDYANMQGQAFDKDGILSADRMQAAFKYAKSKGVTGIWLTGDNLDSASQKNRDLLFGLIDDAKANGIDVTYTMGNHDWNFIDIYFTAESRSKLLPLYKDYMGGNTNVEVKKINNKNGETEMVLLSFNNAENSMTTRQKQFLDTYVKKGIPVIIMQHVPFQNDTLRAYSLQIWGKDITLSEGNDAYTDANIQSTFELFKSEYASNIVGVFAGHFHIANEEKIKGTDVMQYVTEAGFLGSARLITLKPQPCETQTETPQEPVKAESEKAEHGKQGKKWKEEIEKLKSESADFKDKWMRSAAEFENFKRRNADTRRTSYLEGRADVVLKVLPIGDNLERALTMCDENTKKGIEMVLKSFRQFLEGEGIEEIDPLDEEFDPNFCEAIMSEPAAEGVEAGYVKEVFLKGYKRGDKILRYAQVKVTC